MGTIFFFNQQHEAPLQISVSACKGTPGGDVQHAIWQALGLPAGTRVLHIEGIPLKELTWGDSKLHTGAEVTIGNDESPDTSYVVTAVEGPDTGRSYRLTRGEHTLGKGVQAELRVEDDALNDVHGILALNHSGLSWTVTGRTEPIEIDTPFTIGNTIFRVNLASTSRRTGRRRVDLSPIEVELPPKRQSWMYLLMVLAPLVVGVIIVAITKMWLFLVMSIASSLMMGIHWFMSKGESKKAMRTLEKAKLEDEARARAVPTVKELVEGISIDSPQSVFMVLGVGERQAHLKNRNIADYRAPLISDVPLIVPFDSNSRYLLDLPVASVRAVLLGIAAQSCELILLPTRDENLHQTFSALALLPNVSYSSEQKKDNSHLQRIFVVAADRWLTLIPELEESDALLVIGSLPPEQYINFNGVFEASGYFQELVDWVSSTDEHWSCWSQGIGIDTLYRAVGRRLATLDQEFGEIQEAATHRLDEFKLSEYDPRTYYVGDVHAVLGVSDKGLISCGLNADGPHWLIAGTTGAGKSELLRTMLLSLALKYPAQRLSFSLIDFKGGATLGIFEKLPHVSNVLTDLSAESVDRALRYYKADLLAREKEFQKLGVSNYRDYLAIHHAQKILPRFPELVIVVDEFKMLVDQLPQALNDLMRVAVIGRSLGVHLILATQRPQGAVSQDIRANIALNVCLRVASAQDSHNVIGSDIAATISAETPGRGFIAPSGEQPQEFQAPLYTGLYDVDQKPRATITPGVTVESCKLEMSQNFEEVVEKIANMSAIPASYLPVPPELPPTSESKKPGSGIFYLGEAESPELALRDSLVWRPEQDGALAVLEAPAQRIGLLASLLQQASDGAIVFAADPVLYDQLLPAFDDGKLAGLLSSQDLVYCEFIIDHLLSLKKDDGIGSLVLIDSLDLWIELCTRNPDFEAKFHQLLRDGHRFGIPVVATSAQSLRAKTLSSISNVLWSASAIDKDPFKKTSKNFPHPNTPHLVLEGEIAKNLGQDGATTLLISPAYCDLAKVLRELPVVPTLFSQLPEKVAFNAVKSKPAALAQKTIYLGIKGKEPIILPVQIGKFIPVTGKRGSGKTLLLNAIKKLNPEFSYLTFSGKSQLSLEQLEEAFNKVQHPSRTILMIDDLNYLDRQAQDKIIAQAPNFATTLVAYSPWNRWLASPILSGVQGTTRGIALMPDARSLELFMDFELPADLRTNGRLFPGRAVLISDFSATAFQVPYSKK